MKTRAVVLMMLLLVMASSYAIAEETTNKKSIRDTAYENMAEQLNGVRIGQWIVTEQKSILGDRSNFIISNMSLGEDFIGSGTLVISCINKITRMGFGFSERIKTEGAENPTVTIDYKIDDNEIITEQWHSVENGMDATKEDPVNFIKQLMGSKKILIRIERQFLPASLEAAFDLDGLAEAIVPIQKACGWE
jgi:type VI secretion system protein VasI